MCQQEIIPSLVFAPSALSLFEKYYIEVKRTTDQLDEILKPLHEKCQNLQSKLKQTLKQDEECRITKEHKNHIEDFKNRIQTEIVSLKDSIQAAIKGLDYKDEEKLDAAKQVLAGIQIKITELQSRHDKFSMEIKKESEILDHILPKKTANELAAEALRLKKESEKEEKRKQAEVEKLKRSQKVEKSARSKPSTIPITRLPVRLQPPTTKPESKFVAASSSVPREEKITIRIQHLNQACINLIFIHKMLEMYQTELPREIIHYALLYNIFRCFQSLVSYQACGGNKEDIISDEIINLRHMIIHHGASNTEAKEVIDFATSIKGKLSNVLANMKIKREHLLSLEINYSDRQDLLEFTNFAPHNRLIIEETPLYKKLQKFHEARESNDDQVKIFRLVFEEYISRIRGILAQLSKENPPEKKIDPDLFLENYLFLLQALRMLVAMCGEVADYFKEDYAWTSFYAFLKLCRVEVRNPVAHSMDDNFEPLDFYAKTKATLDKLKENEFLTMIGGLPKAPSSTSHSPGFFQPASGSAMDLKFDKPRGLSGPRTQRN
jgi:hypothetical protein